MNERRINFNPAPMPLATIIGSIKNVNRGGLDLQPDYQRDFVWNQDFKEKLIYSLIKRYPIGNISIRNLEELNNKNARSEVVDGQQRLTTIFNFVTGTKENSYNNFKIGNEFARKIIEEIIDYVGDYPDTKLKRLKKKLESKGNISIKYDDLPDLVKADIDTYPLSISYISNATTQQISEYFRFLQNQEALRAGEILKSFPHTYLEKYLNKISDKMKLLEVLNYQDRRLEFDKLFYSIIGLFDRQIPFGSQDKNIKKYVFDKQDKLSENVEIYVYNMINNLNKIIELDEYRNNFIPTKRYLKLLLLLAAFNQIDFSNSINILTKLQYIDKRLAKFSSVYENALLTAFKDNKDLIEEYRKYAEICVRTHSLEKVTDTIKNLPKTIEECPFID